MKSLIERLEHIMKKGKEKNICNEKLFLYYHDHKKSSKNKKQFNKKNPYAKYRNKKQNKKNRNKNNNIFKNKNSEE